MGRTAADLSGKWLIRLPDGRSFSAYLPGTLDENGIGDPDRPAKQWGGGTGEVTTRLTRKTTYNGPASFFRTVTLESAPAGRMILTAERSRVLKLQVNGETADSVFPGTLSTPWVFESKAFRKGENEICLTADNTYPGLPAEAILYSSAATDETQTNWNGVIGKILLEEKPAAFLTRVSLGLEKEGKTACFRAEVSLPKHLRGSTETEITVDCGALQQPCAARFIRKDGGAQILEVSGIPVRESLRRWDPEDPFRYDFRVSMKTTLPDGNVVRDRRRGKAGFRTFGPDGDRRLCVNGRKILIRGETNCAVWPETGHPPMTKGAWKRILNRYRAYGVNCVRFHSHCPPEAAFEAADEAGMLMQPELSHWDPKEAFEQDVSFRYYREELRQILLQLGNHPSFVMLSLGNELACGKTGEKRMAKLVREAKAFLPDRLYARGSNAFYGVKGCDRESDFYTAQNCGKYQLRAVSAGADDRHPGEKIPLKGNLNHTYPSSRTNYREGMAALRKTCSQPMFSFEAGQYETLPDFRELPRFRGVTEPENLRIIYRRAGEKNLLPIWKQMTEAAGELALIGYREETEAVMRTPEMSGLSLLSLQDFPGQGTALVGMMNAHLQPKAGSFARPERFQAFFRDSLPLILLDRYTWYTGETVQAEIRCVHYGRNPLRGVLCMQRVKENGTVLQECLRKEETMVPGESGKTIPVSFALPASERPYSAWLEAFLEGQPESFGNRIRIWVYPEHETVTDSGVQCCRELNAQVLETLRKGGRVLLEPRSDPASLPGCMRGQFSTDFWSVGTFPQQEGGMGLLIAEKHPLFRDFPTSFHTDYQWWRMAGQCAMRLPDESFRPGILVRQMDSFSRLGTYAMLLEARVGRGRILISSMGLPDLPQDPEVTTLRNAMIRYAASADFRPRLKWKEKNLRDLFRTERENNPA